MNYLDFVRASCFYAGLFISTIMFGICSLPMYLFPRSLGQEFIRWWSRFNLWWLGITCGLYYQVEGLDHLPSNEACIVMCKHQSAWETLALNCLLPRQCFVLKRELMRLPFFGWGMGLLEPIIIDRSSHKKAMRHLIIEGMDRLQRDYWVVIFPEGTRVQPAEKGRYLPSAGMLAKKTERSVIAVAHNAGWFWPRNCFWKRPGTIRMIIAPPLDPHNMNARQITQEVEKWIEQTCASLPTS